MHTVCVCCVFVCVCTPYGACVLCVCVGGWVCALCVGGVHVCVRRGRGVCMPYVCVGGVHACGKVVCVWGARRARRVCVGVCVGVHVVRVCI